MNTGRDSEKASAILCGRTNGPDRRRPRYFISAAMSVRSAEGEAMPGISVEIGEGGMSAMVSGLLRVGDTVELGPVAGGRTSALVRHKLGRLYGFEFVGLTAEQAERIAENCKGLGSYRSDARGHVRRA
jgi:hypothetical protein